MDVSTRGVDLAAAVALGGGAWPAGKTDMSPKRIGGTVMDDALRNMIAERAKRFLSDFFDRPRRVRLGVGGMPEFAETNFDTEIPIAGPLLTDQDCAGCRKPIPATQYCDACVWEAAFEEGRAVGRREGIRSERRAAKRKRT